MQHQFPIQLAFAITINKAQGQTLGTTSSCVHPWLNLCHSFSSHMHCKYLCLLHKWKIHNHNQCYVSWNASITNDAIAKWLSQSLRFLNGWYKYIYIYMRKFLLHTTRKVKTWHFLLHRAFRNLYWSWITSYQHRRSALSNDKARIDDSEGAAERESSRPSQQCCTLSCTARIHDD